MSIIIVGDYSAYSKLQSQCRQLIKKLDRQILLINITKPLSPEDQLLIKRRMKLVQTDVFLQAVCNKIIDQMPMPFELASTATGGDLC